MSNSSELAEALIFDIEHDNEEINDTQANAIAIASVTLAINELRKAINDIGKAADATAGFTADIAAALVDPDDYYDDDEEDYTINHFPTLNGYGNTPQNVYNVNPAAIGNPVDFGTIFPSLKVA